MMFTDDIVSLREDLKEVDNGLDEWRLTPGRGREVEVEQSIRVWRK